MNFDEYIRQTEPEKQEKGKNWQIAIGLQQVDGLKPSAYLIETAKQNIEGDITFDEVKKRIDAYYKTQVSKQDDTDDRTEEADKVSARIAEILSEKTFSFTPLEYINIHRRLFFGLYKFAGKIRDYNITKSEWVLDGETVFYSSANLIKETLEYDFKEEKNFNYKSLTKQEKVEHIAKFISGVWQIHAFGEGNTRTTAVFAIKYLRTFGFNVENEPFAKHSWYFRNALVRANYNNHEKNIYATTKYLNRFFENILFGENHILKNCELHIHFVSTENGGVNVSVKDEKFPINNEKFVVNANEFGVKFGVNDEKFTAKDEKFLVNVTDVSVNISVNVSVKEKIFAIISQKPAITVKEMAKILSITERTIYRQINILKTEGIVARIGSDKTGSWKILKMEDEK